MVGCTSKSSDIYFTQNMHYAERDTIQTVCLKGKLVVDDLYGVTDIESVGDYLCIITPR